MSVGDGPAQPATEPDDDKDKQFPVMTIPIKPSHEYLSKVEQEHFNVVEAAEQYYKNGPEAAQTYLNQQGMDDFNIDTELSNPDGIVVQAPGHTESSPKIQMGYRGTDKTNWSDLKADARIAVGLEDWPEGREQFERVVAKYGELAPDSYHVNGFSLGANRSDFIAQNFDHVSSSLFNPFITPKGRKNLTLTAKQILHHTLDDLPSIAEAWSDDHPQLEVRSYAPKTASPYNVIGTHSRSNFRNRTEEAGEDINEMGHLHELEDLNLKAMQYHTLPPFETAVNSGKTFTQAVDDWNSGSRVREVLTHEETGLPVLNGARIHPDSALSFLPRVWMDAGGTFSQQEIDAMKNKRLVDDPNHEPPDPRDEDAFINDLGESYENRPLGLEPSERLAYIQADPEQRAAMQDDLQTQVEQRVSGIESGVMEQPGFASKFGSGLKGSFRPKGLGIGLVGGLVAHETLDYLDPDGKLNVGGQPYVRDAIEGGLSGWLTAAGTVRAGLATAAETGASAGFLPEAAAGAAGYVSGALASAGTDYALKKLNVSKPARQIVDTEAGGIVGGAVTGAGIGLALAPETLGLSVAVGAAGGAIIAGLGAAGGTILTGLKHLWDVL